jgi:transcriptional regulator EpsA
LHNLDTSLAVRTRAQFFTWTQGLLPSLLPHRVLICALRNAEPTSFRVDSFSTLVADSGSFAELLLGDPRLASGLIETWRDGQFQPLVRSTGQLGPLSSGLFGQQLERLGATGVLVHGTHEADGQVRSLFVFGCETGRVGDREIYVLRLIVPFLHWAWVRSQTVEAHKVYCVANVGVGGLTQREREILHWVYLGKSNAEAAAILGISALTVKNHVQKILRKLNAVNRTQAVGKALDARIIGGARFPPASLGNIRGSTQVFTLMADRKPPLSSQ